MVRTFRQIFAVIPDQNRAAGAGVLALMCLSSLVQAMGIVSIMPFLIVLADPSLITENARLNAVYAALGFDTPQQFQIALGVFTFAVLLSSALLKSLSFYAQLVYAHAQRFHLCTRILAGYLAQPYAFFVQRDPSDLAKTVMQEAGQFVDRGLVPAASVLNYGLQFLALIVLLLVLDPFVTVVMAALLGGIYFVVYRFVRPQLLRQGEARHEAEMQRIKALWETLSGIKAIKLAGQEQTFLKRFEAPSRILDRSLAWVALIGTLPRYAIEAVAFGWIVLLALVMTLNANASGGAPGTDVLPVLVVYAFAGYRMMPALQGMYNGLSSIRYMAPNIDSITRQLADIDAGPRLQKTPDILRVRHEIVLKGLSFRHVAEEKNGVRDLTMSIAIGTSFGIVGRSGAGKTTLVDLLLGLHAPQQGVLTADGVPIDDNNRRAWQRNFGYVPQDIYLSSRSVAENIAFGLDPSEIDMEQVIRCAQIAQIHDVIADELPNAYDTQIGERGVRLSGGQRQRIGIARALYFDPAIVVFDEATNALDAVTEARVLRALADLGQAKTLVVIAHRLSSVTGCDQIAVLDDGHVSGIGAYSDLYRDNAMFRDLVDADAETAPTRKGAACPASQ